MTRTPASSARRNPVIELRAAIAEAEGRGVKRAKMLLKLTHSDASMLKRSHDVAPNEISFENGMTFLGVRVETGTVTVSALTTP